jgi:PIN domain nuclease of toxin-antitoxin system
VRLLLDTHIALWAFVNDRRLPLKARELIADTENEVFVSAASLWEVAIKHALARGAPNDMPISAQQAVDYCHRAGYELRNISVADVLALEELPTLHADPFDRILIAQALSTPLRLVTHDPVVARYSDTIIQV